MDTGRPLFPVASPTLRTQHNGICSPYILGHTGKRCHNTMARTLDNLSVKETVLVQRAYTDQTYTYEHASGSGTMDFDTTNNLMPDWYAYGI